MQQAIQHIRKSLADLYPDTELQSISRLLIAKITGFNFTEILVNKNTIFSAIQRDKLDNYLKKLQKHMPIQYVLGETEFCGLNFLVDEAVLIPRPETEELVEWIRKDVRPDAAILDIGTGSGCIAIALKHFLPDAQVFACDISENALLLAKQNAVQNQVKVEFFQTDILTDEMSDKKWDVIVSNPPYIPLKERDAMDEHVTAFEPNIALFVPDDDPLLFYRKIGEFAQKHLNPHGELYVECHRDYADACVQLYGNMGFTYIKLKKDIGGNPRMIKAEVALNHCTVD